MIKHKKTVASVTRGMAAAAWIYVSDPSLDGVYVRELVAMIPNVLHVSLSGTGEVSKSSLTSNKPLLTSITLLSDHKGDTQHDLKIEKAVAIKATAIKYGHNFVSIDIRNDLANSSSVDKFGTNHLEIVAGSNVAEKIYKWLFTVLTIRETLHLIPDEQMKKTDNKTFADYAYCPVSEARSRPKDAKIQFVALVLSKPQTSGANKLTWQVADKTGVANFHFNHRGQASQYTWDWVLALKPGDRTALPRIPMIEIKEKKRTTFVKAPFRLTAAVFNGTGHMFKGVGRGIQKVGRVVKMGPSSEWVPEFDVGVNGKKIDWDAVEKKHDTKITSATPKVVGVFNEKGQRAWSDRDSLASTEAGAEYDEKINKEFI